MFKDFPAILHMNKGFYSEGQLSRLQDTPAKKWTSRAQPALSKVLKTKEKCLMSPPKDFLLEMQEGVCATWEDVGRRRSYGGE